MSINNQISVSIMIPIYNASKYIERCIESVLNQTYTNIECIFVDDCTPDDSMDIVNEKLQNYCGTIKFNIIHHEKNGGSSVARNTAIRNATGDYIYFLDSDDIITPNCIELLADRINNEEQQVDFVIADYEKIENVKRNAKKTATLKLAEGYYYGNDIIFDYYVSHKMYPMPWNKLVKKSFLEINNLWFKEGVIFEDELWNFMLASKAKSMCVVSQKTYLYYIRENSVMTSFNYQKKIDSYTIIMQSISEYAVQNNLDKNLKVLINVEKRNRLSFIDSILSNYKTKETYNNLRKGLHCNPMIFFLKDMKNFIWMFHFFLPKWLGYNILRVYIKTMYKTYVNSTSKCKFTTNYCRSTRMEY